jgi:D-3-phosphoglycerate dehydrogenase / 2-oxoglutarate reductase
MKILNTIGEKYTAAAKNILAQIGEVDYLDLEQAELLAKIEPYGILVIGLGLNIDKQVIDQAKNLKIIATATTGLDHIDLEYAKNKGIEVVSLRGETEFLNTITGTAELAFGLMIDLMRLTCSAFDDVKNYHWDREKFRGHNLLGQTIGIVGLGRLGQAMARYANAFGMKVLAHDPNIDDQVFVDYHCEKTDFETLLKNSDVISIHVHLDKDTANMFDQQIFGQMKDNAYLVNTARGKIVNEKDILVALENKQIAGYATDVLADELNFNQNFANHPLVEYAKTHDNLIIVPHLGGMTYESREATDIFIAEKIKKNLV